MRFCSKCGNKLNDDQLYCPKCGNKEPFVKDSKKSSWKDFEPQKQAGNVNYDFKSINTADVAKTKTPNPFYIKNNGLRGLGIASRIYEIVIGIYFIVFSLVSTFTTIWKSSSGGKTIGNILNIVAIVLGGVQLALWIAIIIITLCTKNMTVLFKGVCISAIIICLIGLGLLIGQYFLYRSAGIAMMGTFTGATSLMMAGMSAKQFPFKKVAK